ncbi:MAG TPA: tRNA (adenosine(37)-N6)-threonylcarbamoyltransferase complex dimerization subunit type 1 TsaB [Gemmatimonadales bacterium]|nr:tRNA (adenosine(37)-N6)-threonylcarbamoyltransferase complex dimerization subunit type 1 TsaB [Gemmatimonadales bacterium]
MWLALDTATDRASVALGEPGSGSRALEENFTGARRHAAELLSIIEHLMRRGSTTLDELSGVIVSDGPGSFTGLRVGASVAKALVHARGLPLWTAPSLLVRAAGVARVNTSVLAVTNALRGELYAAIYHFDADRITSELNPSVCHPEQLVSGGQRPDIAVGDAPAPALAILDAWLHRPVIGPPEGSPHASRMLDLIGRPGGAWLIESVKDWEPVYGRPAEAQARWEKVHGRPLPDSIGSAG